MFVLTPLLPRITAPLTKALPANIVSSVTKILLATEKSAVGTKAPTVNVPFTSISLPAITFSLKETSPFVIVVPVTIKS